MESASLKSKRKHSPYVYLLIIIVAFLTAGFCQYRMQPILTYIMQGMSIDEAQAGYLISAVGILGVVLSVPFGILMGKIGPRKTGLLSFVLIIAGSFVGVAGISNYYVMFVSQFIVGGGICAFSVLCPYIIACVFVPELRGRANGLYITAGTIAQLIMYNLIPRITSVDNVAPAWWLTIIYTVVIGVIWMVFITDDVAPPMIAEPAEGDQAKPLKISVLATLKDPKVLQLSIGGLAFMMSAMAVLSFTPTYLVMDRGYDQVTASGIVSVAAIVGAVSTAVGGWLSDALHTRKWIYFAALIWMAVSRFLIILLPSGFGLTLVIWAQGLPAVCMGLIYTVAGEQFEPEKTSVGISTVNTFIGLGGLIATALFGVLVAAVDYKMTFSIFGIITLVGLLGVFTIKGVK